MASSACTSEIVESKEEPSLVPNFNKSTTLNSKMKAGERYNKLHGSSEEDLNRIIKAIDRRPSSKVIGPLWKTRADLMRKNALKNPIEVRIPESSGIGISESVTLKQALRKLCISQASEMASTKRPPKPIGISGISKSGTIKSPHASVVVKAGESSVPQGEGRDSFAEISLVPEKSTIISSSKETELCQLLSLRPSKKIIYSSHCAVSSNAEVLKSVIQDAVPSSTGTEDILSAVAEKITKGKATPKALISGSHTTVESCKRSTSPRMSKPVLRNKARVRKKGKPKPTAEPGNDSGCREVNRVGDAHSKPKVNLEKISVSPICSKTNYNVDVGKKNKDYGQVSLDLTPSSYKINRNISEKKSGSSSSRENGDYYQSSKSSNGDYSSSSSISCESRRSVSNDNSSRPHMSKDVRWIEIHHVLIQNGSLGLMNFKLLKKLGFGDIGAVYLAELIGSECLFALKVMDLEYLVSRKKMLRAQTEREILQILDHPFLPTLYAHFVTDNLSCLVMEYCPGGDLHVLRQKQPCRSFSESAARFYVAEVLLALEYLHMLGVVYRDLKPENILVREDGHIMLSDFDLSLRCTVSPSLLISSLLGTQEPAKKLSGTCAENSCIVSCFTPRLLSTIAKTRKLKSEQRGQVNPLPQLVVEPTDARSDSFVGTHEYLAPEIIRGDGHGSAVDWWTFGIFLYELLFGRTPFKGPGNEETMANVVSQSLMFPESPAVSSHARDLIVRLLVKEPENRLGSMRGAAEIKQHPFFEGLSWALIRCALPPETPKSYDVGSPVSLKKKESRCLDFKANEEYMEFELF